MDTDKIAEIIQANTVQIAEMVTGDGLTIYNYKTLASRDRTYDLRDVISVNLIDALADYFAAQGCQVCDATHPMLDGNGEPMCDALQFDAPAWVRKAKGEA